MYLRGFCLIKNPYFRCINGFLSKNESHSDGFFVQKKKDLFFLHKKTLRMTFIFTRKSVATPTIRISGHKRAHQIPIFRYCCSSVLPETSNTNYFYLKKSFAIRFSYFLSPLLPLLPPSVLRGKKFPFFLGYWCGGLVCGEGFGNKKMRIFT